MKRKILISLCSGCDDRPCHRPRSSELRGCRRHTLDSILRRLTATHATNLATDPCLEGH
jgi:hypothetical protein